MTEVEAIEELKQALKKTADAKKTMGGVCIEEFVLKHGKSYRRRVLPSGIRRGGITQPFANALSLARENPEIYTYVEGYAAGSMPTLHAWCVDKDGFVIDPTWACDLKKGSDIPGRSVLVQGQMVRTEGKAYFGIPFELDYVISTFEKRKAPGILDNWEQNWPLVSGKEDLSKMKVFK